MDVHEIIKDIKGQFRLFMNGVVSQSMREKGLDYKLNFGIELPRLVDVQSVSLEHVPYDNCFLQKESGVHDGQVDQS